MSASATLPVASSAPDPDRAGLDAPAPDAFPQVGRLLGVLRKLVAYGTNLLTILQQGASAQREALARRAFGTKDLTLIIERIKCGLLRAAGLEVRLSAFVKRGRDLRPAPWRMSMPRERKEAADTEAPAAAVPTQVAPSEMVWQLPSAEEIAEQVRTRPLGVVINDICHDLGLQPGMVDGVLWRELADAFVDCGFSLARFVRGCWKPLFGASYYQLEFPPRVWLAMIDEEMAAEAGQPP